MGSGCHAADRGYGQLVQMLLMEGSSPRSYAFDGSLTYTLCPADIGAVCTAKYSILVIDRLPNAPSLHGILSRVPP